MESTSKMECRLCLEVLTESKWSIEQPDLREKLNQVFRFTIELMPGFSTSICESCSITVGEFHQYSERVRSNQDTLVARLKLPSSQDLTIKYESLDELTAQVGSLDNDDVDVHKDDIMDDGAANEVFVEPLLEIDVKDEPQAKRGSRSQQKPTESSEELSLKREKRPRRSTAQTCTEELKEENEEEELTKTTKFEILEQVSTDEDYDPVDDEDEYQPDLKNTQKRRRMNVRKSKELELKENAEDKVQHKSEKPKRQTKKNASSKDDWQQDAQRIQEFYEMICDLCGDRTNDLLSLRKHFRKEHGKAAYIKCCNKKLMRRGTMVDHILVHANPEAYRCETCDKTFKGKRYLQEHLENVHGSIEERPFKCDQCDRYFAKESMLRTHISNHRKVHCSQCNKEFPNSRFLNEHLKTVHDNAHLTRVCDRCGKSFSGPSARSGLKQHIDGVHMGLGDKTKRQCPICQKWLLGKRCLTVHMQLHSEIGQPHICNICNQNYPHSRALTRHKRFVHGEQKYECEFCGKKFRKSVALKEHRATHTGEALYTCKMCGASTNSNASYYSHMKKQHPIEWAEQKLKAEEANKPAPEQIAA